MVDAAACGPPGRCPRCKRPATRVHSRYWRQVCALPVGGRGLTLRLRVRRFFCGHSQCHRRTLVEQVAGLTEPRRRSSPAARSAMRAVAVELGGRPGQSRTRHRPTAGCSSCPGPACSSTCTEPGCRP
ncbi:transposase family protein [Streptomyces mirabilis]|uniref:transposase family protein n=1 Tax=Streptomyces mirabilis TaxID=68239 RepID=UPI0036CF01C1